MAEQKPDANQTHEPDIDSPWSTGGGRRGGGGPHLWQINWVRDLFFIALVLFLLWFGYYLRGIFTPLLIALFLAYLFHPIITLFERRWNVPRPATITGLIGGITLVVVGLGIWLGPMVVRESVDALEQAPGYAQSLTEKAAEKFDLDTSKLAETIQQKVDEFREDPTGSASQLIKWAFAGTGAVAGVIESVVGATFYVGFMLVLIPFYFFFFAWQFGPLTHAFDRYIPKRREQRFREVLGMMDRAVSAYFRDRVLICGIMAALFAVGWYFCGVPYAILLGLAAGALSLIPYVGGIVWPIAVLLAYLKATTGNEPPGFDLWVVVVWPSVVYMVVQAVEGWVLTPWIQGKSMEMNAVTILVVVFIGGAVGGLYGMILCIPIAACVKILLREVALPKLEVWAREN